MFQTTLNSQLDYVTNSPMESHSHPYLRKPNYRGLMETDANQLEEIQDHRNHFGKSSSMASGDEMKYNKKQKSFNETNGNFVSDVYLKAQQDESMMNEDTGALPGNEPNLIYCEKNEDEKIFLSPMRRDMAGDMKPHPTYSLNSQLGSNDVQGTHQFHDHLQARAFDSQCLDELNENSSLGATYQQLSNGNLRAVNQPCEQPLDTYQKHDDE